MEVGVMKGERNNERLGSSSEEKAGRKQLY